LFIENYYYATAGRRIT